MATGRFLSPGAVLGWTVPSSRIPCPTRQSAPLFTPQGGPGGWGMSHPKKQKGWEGPVQQEGFICFPRKSPCWGDRSREQRAQEEAGRVCAARPGSSHPERWPLRTATRLLVSPVFHAAVPEDEACEPPEKEAGILRNAMCFTFLLIQRQSFLSDYHVNVVADLETPKP